MSVLAPTRPVLRWHGGKWKLAPWIISHFPAHRVYVEPFGGAASVLMRKRRAYAEVYNDLDDDVVNLFRVLQDPTGGGSLMRLLELTPFARSEFEIAWDDPRDPTGVGPEDRLGPGDRALSIERARRLVIRAFMGFGSNAHNSTGRGHKSTGFRANSSRSGTTPAEDWANYPAALPALIERLRGVVIERRHAHQVMAAHDAPGTLHYVDPPYMQDTRSPANKYDGRYRMYRHEMSDADHAALLEFLRGLTGMVVLSGYPHPLYDEALMGPKADWRSQSVGKDGWERVEREALADGARRRIEVLWINPAAAERLRAARRDEQLQLLEPADGR